jgi:hypothetical protein
MQGQTHELMKQQLPVFVTAPCELFMSMAIKRRAKNFELTIFLAGERSLEYNIPSSFNFCEGHVVVAAS